MGGHGALTIAFKQPDAWSSVRASSLLQNLFAPTIIHVSCQQVENVFVKNTHFHLFSLMEKKKSGKSRKEVEEDKRKRCVCLASFPCLSYRQVSAMAPIVDPLGCAWGTKALNGYLAGGAGSAEALDYSAVALLRSRGNFNGSLGEVLVDQGANDEAISCPFYVPPLRFLLTPLMSFEKKK